MDFRVRLHALRARGQKGKPRLTLAGEPGEERLLGQQHLQDNIADIFTRKNEKDPDAEQQIDNLYKEIGRIQVENGWLKKKLGL